MHKPVNSLKSCGLIASQSTAFFTPVPLGAPQPAWIPMHLESRLAGEKVMAFLSRRFDQAPDLRV
jgi:hypothetical protein